MREQAVSVRREGKVAVVTIDNPPVNAMSQPVRAQLLDAVETATAEPGLRRS